MQSKIKKFNDALSKYMWACVVDGKLAPNDEDYWTEYRTVPPNVFERVKAGCCWDYCNYQADYFKKNFPGIKFSLYYIDSDDINEEDSTNHTWMAYFLDGKVYAFEASWKSYKGIHEFKSVDEMLDWYAKNQFRNYKKAGYPPYVIYEYDRPPKDNLKPEDFMLYIFRYGKLLRNHNGKFEKYVKPLKSAGWKWIWTDTFYFYHMVPKGSDVSVGLLSPYSLAKIDKHLALKALDKYRNRMVGGWEIYPGRDPSSLTLDELMYGLEKFRDKGGSRQIHFFRYPPDASLGPNMKEVLKNKDIYRIDLMDKELQKHIERIYWGTFGSFTGNPELSEEYYRTVTRKEYFKDYKDNPKPGVPLFAPIPHIGIVFKNGICPAKFIKKFEIVGENMINSHDEMSAMMEVACNDRQKPFLEKIVIETGHWPSWMDDDQIQYVQENGFDMKSNQSNIESLKEYAEKLKADGLISGYDINNNELRLSSISGKYNELEDRVKASISSLGAYSYYKLANRGRMPVPGYPKLCIRLKNEVAEESYVAEASKPKDYKIKGQLLFRKLDTATIKRHIRSCPALKNAKTGPGIKSLVIIKLGGFGRTYREYVGEIAGYVTCNSKGEVLSRWVSPKAKNFGINAKLDAFVKKPVIESTSCFVTEGIISSIKNRFSTEVTPKDKLNFIIDTINNCHDILTKIGDKSFYHCFRKLNTPSDKDNLKKFCKGRYKYAQVLYYNKKWYKGSDEEYIKNYRKFRAVVNKINCPRGLGITFAKGSNENDGYIEVVCHDWKPTRESSIFVTEAQKIRARTSDLDLTNIQFIKAPHVKGGGICNNSLLVMDGKKYRVRVETLVYNDRGQVLATKRDKASKYGLWYNLPGGSIEPNKSLEEQAEAECHEEVFAKVKNIKNTGIWFINMYPNKGSENPKVWDYTLAVKYGLDYDGAITLVFVGEYDGEFGGKVKAEDKVDWGKKAKFYDPDDIGLSEVHRKALSKAHINTNESYFTDSLSEGTPGTMHQPAKTTKMHRKMMSRKAMKPMNGPHKNIVSNESTSVFKTELVTESADDMVYVMISQGEDYFNSPQASMYIDSYKTYPIDQFMEYGTLFSVYPVEGKLVDCEDELKKNIAKVLDVDKSSVTVCVVRNRGKMKVKGLPRIDISINDSDSVVNESASIFVTENNDTQPLDILEKDEVHYPHKMYMTKKDFNMRTKDPSKEYDPPRNFNNLSDIAGLELQTFKGYKDLNDDIKIIFHSGGDYNRIGYIRCPESGIQLVKKWMADCSARSERFDYFIKDSKGNGGKFELWFNPKTYHNSEC